jgi:Fcf2 pre-rRNA processing
MRAIFIHSYSDCRVDVAKFKITFQRRLLTRMQNDELSAGSDWFNLPKTVLTPQLKRDFQLLEMRSVLDPHR